MDAPKTENGEDKRKRGLAARVGIGLLIAGAYAVTGTLGLRFNAVSGFATLLWPPTGIALAAVFFLGYWCAPAVALGAFVTNLIMGAPAAVALGIAAGNMLEAVLGAYLLRRAKFSPTLRRAQDALKFIGYAVLLSTLASAAIGVLSLYLGGVVTPDAIAPTWTAWWVGDALGDLVFGATLLVIVAQGRKELRLHGSGEAFALAAALLGVGLLVFFGPVGVQPLTYLVFVPLLWAALRFEQVGTMLATLAVLTMAVGATAIGRGPFAGPDLSRGLVFLQLFIGVVASTKLIVAAVQTERREALEEMKGFNRDLEGQVLKRTLQLSRTNEELKRVDTSLTERHAVLLAVVRGIGEGVIAADTSGSPIVVNPAAANIMGIPLADAPKHLERMFALFPAYYPDGATEVPMEDRPISRAIRGETTENEHLVIKSPAHPDGVHIAATGTPIIDDKGRRIGGVVVFREIPR